MARTKEYLVDELNKHRSDWVLSALRQYEGPLTRYAAHITGDVERARDVVQDTFIRLCSENPRRLENCLAEWLFTVCRNRALDVNRKERRMTPLTEIDLEVYERPGPSPALAAEQRESAAQLLEMLGALPPNQQEVLRLKFQNDLSYEEISRVTHLSVSNVGYLIHTGIKTIRQQLRARETSASATATRKAVPGYE